MSLLARACQWIQRVFEPSPPPPKARKAAARRRRERLMLLEKFEDRNLMAGMEIGMNLDWIADYAPAWVFKDAFQQSRSWMTWDYNLDTRAQSAGTRAAHVDGNGWPTMLEEWTNGQGQRMQQRLQTVMYLGTNGAAPAGVYRAEWEGTGTLSFLGDAAVTQRGTTPDGHSFALLNVTPTNAGIHLRIDSMSSTDPVRNIHVWLPDFNGESFAGQVWRPGANFSPFHPLFVERLEPFDTIRFMQAANTITSDEVAWADRRPVTAARQAVIGTEFQNGMSLEYQIELANELDANAWFNMPHMANDDYVRNFATMVRDTLEPNLTIYVEYSNELWNWAPGFESHYWARAQADAEGIRIEEVVARETLRDFDIWTEVFAGQTDRIVRTVGGFHAAPGVYGWNNQIMSRLNGRFDALAVAPYVSPTQAVRATYTTATTVDQVLADTRTNIEPVAGLVRQAADLLHTYEVQFGRDLQLVTYEGGTHLDIPTGAAYRQAFFDAAVDPRMYDLITDYLHAMEGAGADAFNYYKFTDRRVPSLMNSDFGTLSRMDQALDTAHRYRVLIDFLAEPDPPTEPVLVTMVATDAAAAEAGRNPAFVTVTRTGPTTESLAVSYSISGSAANGIDFDSLSGAVTIAAGQASATVSITPIDDLFVENSETVILTLLDADSYDLGSAAAATATITSDDIAPTLPMVGIFVSDSLASETNRNVAVFTVRRTTEGMNQPLTVNYSVTGTAANGSDFNQLSGSVTIPAGAAATSIVVTPIDDTEVEVVETIVLTLAASPTYRLGTTASQTASASLSSNDQPAPVRPAVTVVATDAAASEAGRDPGIFTITRAGGSVSLALVVNYTLTGSAANGQDFTSLSGRVTIPAGQTSAAVTITPVDDSVIDVNETAVLTISANSAYVVGAAPSATVMIADNDVPTQQPLPVLMVIANRDFYYQEYADPRAQFEAASIPVVVAAGRRELSTPHANSGQGSASGQVMPDLALADVNAANYSAIVFVGGWGASQYQYAFTGTYNNPLYNGTTAIRERVNQLINDFVAQQKLVTALCHGVSILAWARVGGQSLLAGRTVSVYNGTSPPSNIAAAQLSRWHSDVNGATVLTNGQIGNQSTRTDDVWTDGQIITGENFDSARQFGITVANRLRNP